MKAAVWYKRNDIRIEDIPEPEPDDGQVKVKVKVCGICASDIHEYREGPFLIPFKPHPLTKRKGGPVVLGHEFSGEVAELGQGAKKYKIGDRVVVNPLIVCGDCNYCKHAVYNMCLRLGTTGFAADGGFAEFAVVPEYSLSKLPDSISDDMAAFVEPLSVAIHAVKRSSFGIGDKVTVIGAGPIGLLVMEACIAAGSSNVFIVDPIKTRLEVARRLGASALIDPKAIDPGKAILDLTDELRSDIAFDCVGSQSAFDTALKVTRRRGVICVVGLSLKPIKVPFLKLWGHEKKIIFSSAYENEFPTAIGLLTDGRVDVESLVSARIKLDHLIEDGIKALLKKPRKYLKILVYP